MTEQRSTEEPAAAAEPAAVAAEPDSVEPSSYHVHDLVARTARARNNAATLQTTPHELAAALYGREGPFSREQIQEFVREYRARVL
jgi:hypothetical protein